MGLLYFYNKQYKMHGMYKNVVMVRDLCILNSLKI